MSHSYLYESSLIILINTLLFLGLFLLNLNMEYILFGLFKIKNIFPKIKYINAIRRLGMLFIYEIFSIFVGSKINKPLYLGVINHVNVFIFFTLLSLRVSKSK